jgi:hypothetical protein
MILAGLFAQVPHQVPNLEGLPVVTQNLLALAAVLWALSSALASLGAAWQANRARKATDNTHRCLTQQVADLQRRLTILAERLGPRADDTWPPRPQKPPGDGKP